MTIKCAKIQFTWTSIHTHKQYKIRT